MIAVALARETIRRHARALPPETVTLSAALDRILREPVAAAEDVPPFDRSAMDGYVVRLDDAEKEWRVVGEIRAGQTTEAELRSGETMRIFTGAALPFSAQPMKVIMQEDVEAEGDRVRLLHPSENLHIRRRGEDARAGEILFEPGARLNPAAIGLLAGLGKTSVAVSRAPRVFHLTTGDEIVAPESPLGPGQIRNSNAFLVSALVREHGGLITHRHAPDRLEAMLEAVREAEFDLLLVSGGSGGGKYDFTGELFRALEASIQFHQVDVRPGKPLLFGTAGARLIFGLPGNALSHFICFHLFVRAALEGLLGLAPGDFSSALLAAPMEETRNGRETWWPVQSTFREGRREVRALPWKSSGDITRLAGADGLMRIPAQTARLSAGAVVDYLSLR
jgi:molybdopterin molybdotransferase